MQGAKEDLASAGYGGILLGGNYVAGVALGKCVEYGYEYANEIAKYLNDETAVAQTNTQGRRLLCMKCVPHIAKGRICDIFYTVILRSQLCGFQSWAERAVMLVIVRT